MRLRPEQLAARLAGPLPPICLISGDDPLLVQESRDLVCAAARRHGYTERVVFDVEASFDWAVVAQTAGGMSLFDEKRLIELRIPGGKPGEAGAAALISYGEHPVEGNLLLLCMPRLEKAAQGAKWFKAIDQAGMVIQIWPPAAGQLPGWIAQRMRAKGMQPVPEAAAALAERVEGNLLACAQEIEKLLLLHGPGAIGVKDVMEAVADSARFDVYTLVDGALAGDPARSLRVLRGLQGEGVEPVLIVWALAREIRLLATLSREVAQGAKPFALFQQHRIWEKRQPLVEQALRRHGPHEWGRMLRLAARIDRMIKGQTAGNVWDELIQLCFRMAGVRIEGLAGQTIS